jgi:hypothetical protein
LTAAARTLRSGDLELAHAPDQFGGFVLRVTGERMAVGFTRPLIGYVRNGAARWLDLAQQAAVRTDPIDNGFGIEATLRDPDGGDWKLTQRFTAAKSPGAIDVETTVTVSRDREVVYLPMLLLLPGIGSFGTTKHQALFAGLEYLDRDEPSSSEADIRGPGAKRLVPDTRKITIPLMAIQAEDRYIGLIWDGSPPFSAVFDSPDRQFKAGGHLMGVIFPGGDEYKREPGHLLPYGGERLAAHRPLTLRVTIIGGKGTSVVPAVQQYVARRGLPPVPKTGLDGQGYLALAAAGWLDSAIHVGAMYRHAYPGGFGTQAAADAALTMDWIARQTTDTALARRLADAAREAVAVVLPQDLDLSGVGHIRYPVASLVYGHAAENAARAREDGRGLLSRFEPDGSVLYRKSPNGLDFGKTHFAPDANGLTAQMVASLLEKAAVSGDADLKREGLRVLRALDKFADTVPRGAQTWEVPLHTPDILASAHLVRAYTLGYELTGDAHFLEQARYWAWTGVPFVYLRNPTGQPIGPYATIAVLGASNWEAPNWMGLPVQWCGLVYADALYRLVRCDPSGPWKRLADGIAASGVQQTWPRGSDPERQGLLPDSFSLLPQTRNDAAINPGTLLVNALRLYHLPALYDFRAFPTSGLLVRAPGALTDAQERQDGVSFTVRGWPDSPYTLFIAGLPSSAPRVRINGRETPLSSPHEYLPEKGWLLLQLEGTAKVELRH